MNKLFIKEILTNCKGKRKFIKRLLDVDDVSEHDIKTLINELIYLYELEDKFKEMVVKIE